MKMWPLCYYVAKATADKVLILAACVFSLFVTLYVSETVRETATLSS